MASLAGCNPPVPASPPPVSNTEQPSSSPAGDSAAAEGSNGDEANGGSDNDDEESTKKAVRTGGLSMGDQSPVLSPEEIEHLKNLENLKKFQEKNHYLAKIFSQICRTELAPFCSIVGGLLVIELLKSVGPAEVKLDDLPYESNLAGEHTVELKIPTQWNAGHGFTILGSDLKLVAERTAVPEPRGIDHSGSRWDHQVSVLGYDIQDVLLSHRPVLVSLSLSLSLNASLSSPLKHLPLSLKYLSL